MILQTFKRKPGAACGVAARGEELEDPEDWAASEWGDAQSLGFVKNRKRQGRSTGRARKGGELYLKCVLVHWYLNRHLEFNGCLCLIFFVCVVAVYVVARPPPYICSYICGSSMGFLWILQEDSFKEAGSSSSRFILGTQKMLSIVSWVFKSGVVGGPHSFSKLFCFFSFVSIWVLVPIWFRNLFVSQDFHSSLNLGCPVFIWFGWLWFVSLIWQGHSLRFTFSGADWSLGPPTGESPWRCGGAESFGTSHGRLSWFFWQIQKKQMAHKSKKGPTTKNHCKMFFVFLFLSKLKHSYIIYIRYLWGPLDYEIDSKLLVLYNWFRPADRPTLLFQTLDLPLG